MKLSRVGEGQLVIEQIYIDPILGFSTYFGAKDFSIEFMSGIDMPTGQGNMEWKTHNGNNRTFYSSEITKISNCFGTTSPEL